MADTLLRIAATIESVLSEYGAATARLAGFSNHHLLRVGLFVAHVAPGCATVMAHRSKAPRSREVHVLLTRPDKQSEGPGQTARFDREILSIQASCPHSIVGADGV